MLFANLNYLKKNNNKFKIIFLNHIDSSILEKN